MSGTPMKRILTQEVTGVGGPGDVVEVAGGYGRNYLVPRGLAMRWSRGAEKQIDLIRRARAVREIRGVDDARDAAGRLAALTVRLHGRAGGGGRGVGPAAAAGCSARCRLLISPPRSRRLAGLSWISARSRSRTRSRRWERIRWLSGCIRRSARH